MKLYFATSNKGKLKEVETCMPEGVFVLSTQKFGHFEVIESADSIQGNALLKARFYAQRFDVDCFADDTCLEIDALNGAPGVYSARYAGPKCDSDANMEKVLKELQGQTDRSARFRTVLALILNGEEFLFDGVVEGDIIEERTGDDGFGYDPIFKPNGYDQTFAQMSIDEKNQISHRGRALRKLVDFLSLKDK